MEWSLLLNLASIGEGNRDYNLVQARPRGADIIYIVVHGPLCVRLTALKPGSYFALALLFVRKAVTLRVLVALPRHLLSLHGNYI
jgi:hypothetical protein